LTRSLGSDQSRNAAVRQSEQQLNPDGICVSRAALDQVRDIYYGLCRSTACRSGIKDIIETADMPTEQGSPLFVGCRTGRDAASVAALREAGDGVPGQGVKTGVA